MTITVPVYHPDIRVTLYKTIKRDKLDDSTPVSARFKGMAQTIDLTPFLSETGGMSTTKSVREAAGGFSLVLADKPHQSAFSFETLYGLLEPMDFVEVRMRHGTAISGSPPPIVMRGFISDVQRGEGMSPDGKPQRSVTLAGQDYGKLWQMLQILYLPGYVVGQDTLSNFRLYERFGAGFATALKASDFVQQTVEKVLNPYVKKLMPENTPNPAEVKFDIAVKHGTTDVPAIQNREGTIYELLRVYGDVGVWNELFLEDREDGVYCVYRPNPYYSVAGKKIQDDAPDVEVIDIDGKDILSLAVSRSDANIANYYWVRSQSFNLNSDIYRRQYAVKDDRKTVLLGDYPNSDEKLYGIRLMFVDTMQGGDAVKTHKSGQSETEQGERDTGQAGWIDDRRRILVEQNKDNVVFERGSMRIRGNERVRAGTYVRIHRGDFTAKYYVTHIRHDYVPFGAFISTLMVERGTGFIERAKREGGPTSPYMAELLGAL